MDEKKFQECTTWPVPKVYLAGPMSGLPGFNFAAFQEAARRLRLFGFDVTNPAELDSGDTSLDWTYYLKRDLPELLKCEAIVLLSGWEKSRGANLELQTARAVGMKAFCYRESPATCGNEEIFDLLPLAETTTILDEAKQLTGGERNDDYGHPLDDFGRSAAMWSAILGARVTPEQVGLCMIALKLARQCHRPKRDNLVDAAGYARTLEMIADEREIRARSA